MAEPNKPTADRKASAADYGWAVIRGARKGIARQGLHLCGEGWIHHDELTLADLRRHVAWMRRSRAAEDKVLAKERAEEDAYVESLREMARRRPRR